MDLGRRWHKGLPGSAKCMDEWNNQATRLYECVIYESFESLPPPMPIKASWDSYLLQVGRYKSSLESCL
jgi:hypothetical protein